MTFRQNNMLNTPIILLLKFVIGFTSNGSAQDKVKKEKGFIQIFNGKNIEDWEGDTLYWRVENGILTGEVTAATILKRNCFIVWKKSNQKILN